MPVVRIIESDRFSKLRCQRDLIEIRPASSGKPHYLPMVEPYVGEINTEERTIRIEPAEEFMS